MYVIDEERDGLASCSIYCLTIQFTFFHKFMVKIDKEKRLILNIRKEVILSNKVENIRSSKADKVGQCFAGLAVGGISGEIVGT